MSTRRLHHHNLQQDNISNYDSDDLKDNEQQHQPRTVLGNYKPPNNKTSNMKESHAVLDALSDGKYGPSIVCNDSAIMPNSTKPSAPFLIKTKLRLLNVAQPCLRPTP